MPSGSWANEPTPPLISVQSPSKEQKCYSGSKIWLNFTVTKPKTSWYSRVLFPERSYATILGSITQVKFSLDGKQENTATRISEYMETLYFACNLELLLDGPHTVVITAEGVGYYGNLTHDIYVGSGSLAQSAKTKFLKSSVQINFVVGEAPPVLQVLSPENKTYDTSQISLDLIADLPEFTEIAFSLD